MSRHVPDFSIVTPSFNTLKYLPSACASVADQEGATFEHTVVDAVSTDGTVEWLAASPEVASVVEPDRGMYDAINKGWLRANGHIVAWLNCDEQYLPGTLAAVKQFFDSHPSVDWVYGDYLQILPDGELDHYRKLYPVRPSYILSSHLTVGSCTIFLRRKIINDGMLIDSNYRYCGDAEYVLRLLRNGYCYARMKRYLAAATLTGRNMVASPGSLAEIARFRASAPALVRCSRHPITLIRFAEKALNGAYLQKSPLEYDVYTTANTRSRTRFSAARPSWRFNGWELTGDPVPVAGANRKDQAAHR